MITSMYYQSVYRPNLFKSMDTKSIKQNLVRTSAKGEASPPVNLSTAYKQNVLSYAKELSSSVNDTRTSSDEIINLVKDLSDDENTKPNSKELKKKKSDSDILKGARSGIKKLANALNKTISFSKDTSQSDDFDKFSINLKDIVANSDGLKDIGIDFADNKYSLDEEIFEDASVDKVKNSLEGALSDLNKIYSSTREFLSKPLSSHMEFKSFSYYYSYSAGIMKNNSFNLIETGTLLNLEL